MLVLAIFAILSVWRIYTAMKYDKCTQRPPMPPPVIKTPHRLQLETTIRKIAGTDVSEEKLSALTLESPHTLVQARAGSGKTYVIALKTALAIHTGTKSQNTLSLCFNKSAARELGDRFTKYGAGDAPTSTFHALAHAIIRPRPETLLFGERQSELIRHLIIDDAKKHRKSVDVDELIDDVVSFISFAKQKGLSTENVRQRCGSVESFASRAASLYAVYTDYLMNHGLIDFNDLIKLATVTLEASGRAPIVRLNGKTCDLNALQLLAIDEFQDFSHAFYGLVRALMPKNLSMRIFAVGDDFQSINAFAGSSPYYFQHFETLFPDGKRSKLITNYRSGNAIVDYASYHMRGLGEAGIAVREGGGVEHLRISKYGPVHEVTKRLIVCERHRSVLVLARRNVCHGIDLSTWQKDLSLLHPNVRVSTIHAAKGAESDVVFFLKEHSAENCRLSRLNTVLGITEAEVQAEERRIEYVAITRAKERLLVIE